MQQIGFPSKNYVFSPIIMASNYRIEETILDEIELKILSGRATIRDCCKQLRLLTTNGAVIYRNVDPRTLQRLFLLHDRDMPQRPSGLPPDEIEARIEKIINTIRAEIDIGVSNMFLQLNHRATKEKYGLPDGVSLG